MTSFSMTIVVLEKKNRKQNNFKEHLAIKQRKQRKDCPNYIEVVRTFAHCTFRPDTFAKRKVMIKNDDGTYEYHLPHIQNNSIKDTHDSFMESELYHDWQYQNRWNKKDNHGNELAILPTICLRLFYYAMCPCCKNPSQRDCADSLVIGFSHLLCGLGKIRNSEVGNKKQSISDCNCVYHSRQENRDLWRSTNDFMLGMLCTPIEYTEFQNPEISQYSTQVIKIVVILHSY